MGGEFLEEVEFGGEGVFGGELIGVGGAAGFLVAAVEEPGVGRFDELHAGGAFWEGFFGGGLPVEVDEFFHIRDGEAAEIRGLKEAVSVGGAAKVAEGGDGDDILGHFIGELLFRFRLGEETITDGGGVLDFGELEKERPETFGLGGVDSFHVRFVSSVFFIGERAGENIDHRKSEHLVVGETDDVTNIHFLVVGVDEADEAEDVAGGAGLDDVGVGVGYGDGKG